VVFDAEICWGYFSLRTEGLAIGGDFAKQKENIWNWREVEDLESSIPQLCVDWSEVLVNFLELHELEFIHAEDKEEAK